MQNNYFLQKKIIVLFLFLWSLLSGEKEKSEEGKRILFGGDICFGETYQLKLEQQGKVNILKTKGYDYSFEKLDSLLSKADVIIGNLETPITDILNSSLSDSSKYRIHKGDIEKTPSTLKRHNISVVSLANNHTMDYGAEGIKQTMEILRNNSINFFAAGRNESEASVPYQLNYDLGGRTLHVVVVGGLAFDDKYEKSYSFYSTENKPGVKEWTLGKVTEQIETIRKADSTAFIIAYPHWLENYKWKSEQQSLLAHAMIEAGADIVIGHGTHMFQEIEQYKNKWIIYSLGNLVFNAPGRYDKKQNAHPYSLAAMLILNEKSQRVNIALQLYPIFTNNLVTNYQSHLVGEKEFDETKRLLLTHSPDSIALQKELKLQENKIGFCFELMLKTNQ